MFKLIDVENVVCLFVFKYGKGNFVEYEDNVVLVEFFLGDNKLVMENFRNKLNKDDKKEVCDVIKDCDVNEFGRVFFIGNISNLGICDFFKWKISIFFIVFMVSFVGLEDNELLEKKVDLIGLIESVGILLFLMVSNLFFF